MADVRREVVRKRLGVDPSHRITLTSRPQKSSRRHIHCERYHRHIFLGGGQLDASAQRGTEIYRGHVEFSVAPCRIVCLHPRLCPIHQPTTHDNISSPHLSLWPNPELASLYVLPHSFDEDEKYSDVGPASTKDPERRRVNQEILVGAWDHGCKGHHQCCPYDTQA